VADHVIGRFGLTNAEMSLSVAFEGHSGRFFFERVDFGAETGALAERDAVAACVLYGAGFTHACLLMSLADVAVGAA
jgi:hypothetical protein